MRIALCTDNFYPELTGIGDSLTLFSQELVKRGHTVLIIAPRYLPKDYSSEISQIKEREIYKGISIVRLPSITFRGSPTGQGRIVIPYGKSIAILKKFKPDIIHTNSPFGVGIDALIASRILRIPLVGTNHTIVSEFIKYGPVHSSLIAEKFFAWYYNRCLFMSAPCNALISHMRKYGFHRTAESISNPVPLADFYPPSSESDKEGLKRKFGFSRFTILYCGRLAPEKGIDVIIRALPYVKALLPEVNLALLGGGVYEDKLRSLALGLGLGGSVKFLGFIPMALERFKEVYRASDVFSIMSTSDTQSLTLMQACATGLPTVGARAWGLEQYVKEAGGILVEPGDVEKTASALVSLLKNPDERTRIGLQARNLVKNFAPSVIAEKWEKIYINHIS